MARHAWLATLAVLASACHGKESRWIDVRAKQMHAGNWVVEIPAGWRDIHELRDQTGIDAPPDWRYIIPEDDSHFGEVGITEPPDTETWRNSSCDKIAKGAFGRAGHDSEASDVENANVGGDPGCLMRIRVGQAPGLFAVRIHGRDVVIVRCLGRDAHLDGGSACDRVLYGLRIGK